MVKQLAPGHLEGRADRDDLASVTTREISRRRLLMSVAAGGAAFSLGGLLSACTAQGPSASPATSSAPSLGAAKAPEKLTFAIAGVIPTLDPAFATVLSHVHSLGYESLLMYGSDGKLYPQLAESWSQPDLVTYVYKLRNGVRFWDGSPLTADDVAFSLNRVRDPQTGSGWGAFWSNVKSIDATGPLEVTVKLNAPDALFRFYPGFGGSRITSMKFAGEHPKDLGTTAALTMGTGPYRFTNFSPQGATAERNDSYWGAKPGVRQVEVRFIADEATRLLAMRSGDIDGAFTIPLDQLPQWKALEGVTTITAPQLYVTMFQFDVQVAPWNDVHVRRAVACCVDKKGLVQAALGGRGTPASAVATPEQWAGLLNDEQVKKLYAELDKYPFDLQKAKQELAQSAYASGFTYTMIYPDNRKNLGLAAENLSRNLKQIGVTLNVKEVVYAQYLNTMLDKAGGAYARFWSATTTDAAEQPTVFFTGKFAGQKRNQNSTNYANPRVDQLLDEQQKTADPAVRARALSDILRILADDVPAVPLWYEDIAMAIKSKYVFADPAGRDNFSAWTRWHDWPALVSVR